MIGLQHPPSRLIVLLLVGAGHGSQVVTDFPPTPWPVYYSAMPAITDDAVAAPTNCIGVYDPAGLLDGRLMATGEQIEHPGIQIRVRSSDYDEGYAKIRAIQEYLLSIRREQVTVDEVEYLVNSVSLFSPIVPLGPEQGSGNKTELFVANFRCTISVL